MAVATVKTVRVDIDESGAPTAVLVDGEPLPPWLGRILCVELDRGDIVFTYGGSELPPRRITVDIRCERGRLQVDTETVEYHDARVKVTG